MFCSRDSAYRDPIGAVEEGTAVHFRITLPRELACSAAHLVVEQEGVRVHVSDLFWCGMNGEDREWWECHFTPPAPGLYFYHFEAKTCRGRQRLSRGYGGRAEFGGMDRWQMTVYSHELKTPDWLAGGVMYQIFPDRFYRSNKEKDGVPGDRTLRDDWGAEPVWRPNEQGAVTNSDYFGGDLNGVREKLPYLQSLGVTCIYFNPIFEAHSNHRYNTADYAKIDPLLGKEEDFEALCEEARSYGIRIIIDGVFSHTGSDSVYFNREGRYPTLGAYQSKESPYYTWYAFHDWPQGYSSWWNFDTLPNVLEVEPSYDEYINGENGIVRKWLKAGASGWRLDVADELPDEFIDRIYNAARAEKPDAFVLGEVWEDASNKSAYGVRRRYLLGGQLDSVMNYPFRDAIFGFLLGGDPKNFAEAVESLLENYPPQSIKLLMNHIGTHDTERALTVLGGEPAGNRGREWQSAQRLTQEQRTLGIRRLKLASFIQYLLPGVPCLYYGDEAGMEGYRDPFNRFCYPWGQEDETLLAWYRTLGSLRLEQKPILAEGAYRTLFAENGLLIFQRGTDEERLIAMVNREDVPCALPELSSLEFSGGQLLLGELPDETRSIPAFGCCLVKLPAQNHGPEPAKAQPEPAE